MAKTNKAAMGGAGHGSMKGVIEKPKNFKKTIRRIVSYLKPYWGLLIAAFICSIISAVFAIVGPKILGNMTTEIVKGFFVPTGINFDKIAEIGAELIVIYCVSALFSYLQSWVMTRVSQNVTYKLRRDVSEKIARLPLRYFDRHEIGDTVSYVTNDIEVVSQNLNQSVTQIITAITTIVGILVMMISISWELTLIALAVLPISAVMVKIVTGKSQKHFTNQQTTLGEINGFTDEIFSNHAIVKTFNGQERALKEFNRVNQRLYVSNWKSQFLSGLMMPIMQVINNLGYVGVAVIGGKMALNGNITIGDVQAFIQYMNQFTQPIAQTANIANVLQATAAAAERVFNFLASEEQKTEFNLLPTPKSVNGEVQFHNVHFGYNADEPIIKHFSVHIKPHQSVAIVGPTGAGKTTIVNLLMRFYDIDRGEILIDGIETRRLARRDVRKMFGMVLQDTWLFSGTIAENIAYGKPNATREEIRRAAQAAHVDHLINTLPDGYDTVMHEAAESISAGEKQLLTIARAILADAPMLILDEATSSVDTRTESLIQSAMDKLSHGRTSFVIAHRLSTIRDADVILVMRDGDIVEQGKHQELLDKHGYYADLYNSQFVNS